MSNPHDYTVGWICATITEYIAAQAFLDEEHNVPDYTSPNDNNDYTLGRIGSHNIVIAVLPYGEYGVSSAASVARDMLHSFPNVRIGLLVGIGGGAPSAKHDIRLGDVVVGVPNNGEGGVVQYDFGKAIQGQEFQETGFLNQPPTLLRAAVGGLMAQYMSNGNQIKEAINSALAQKPRLRRKYEPPEAATDRLYQSHVVHPSNSGTVCGVTCGEDPSNVVERLERDDEDDDPAIHYGLIASANTLLKDASVRDELVKKKGVLCFESEAAGLMNHFPCLVVRGICDYSDSHEYGEWQGYAAMTAAAYAKDLLRRIAPNKVDAEKSITTLLTETAIEHRDISKDHRDIAKDHRDIAKDHRHIAKEQLQVQKDFAKERLSKEEQECHQLFRLTSNGKDTTYEWYKDRVEERVEDTCQWFLEHEHYQKWLEQDSGPLLVTADPGCGKSVLAKYLVDYGLPRSATICYFFFKDQDQNTSCQALCALLHQLFSQKLCLLEHAITQFHEDGKKMINSTTSLWRILKNSIEDPQAGSIIIVLDALDECSESDFENLTWNIESQFGGYQSGGRKCMLKYFLTCRPYQQLISQFRGLLRSFPNIHIPGEEESEVISREVNYVIIYRVKQMQLLPQLEAHLKEKLQEIPHRTYLWVYLIFDYLKQESFKKTLKGVEFAIGILPRSVNEAYERILNKSKEDIMVRKALGIVLAANRPLTLSEMNIAMNIDETTETFDDLDLEGEDDFKSRLRSWCGLFISIYHGKVYFLHQTAREFLLTDLASPTDIPSAMRWHHSISPHQAHDILAKLCVLYLHLFNSGDSPNINVDKEIGCSTDSTAFLSYSAEHWGMHFSEACVTDNDIIVPFALRICDTNSKSYLVWFKIYSRTRFWLQNDTLTDLIIASHYGHRAVVKMLVEKGAYLEAKNKYGQTPLFMAALDGREDIVRLLVEKGADLEAKDNESCTPLLSAVGKRDEDIIDLLIDLGADLEAKGNKGRTPLLCAAWDGAEAIFTLLVEKGADLEAKDNDGRTPLSHAASGWNEATVEMLIKKGADLHSKDNDGRTPLSHAASGGYEATVELLIKEGADLHVKDNDGRTPLSHAASGGYEATVALLIKYGADLHAKDNDGRTPLSHAASDGYEATVALLIKEGADLHVKDNNSRPPLSYATEEGNEAIFRLLVDKGADLDAKDNYGWTPLLYAALNGNEAIIKQLVEKGADLNVKDNDGWTVLLLAALYGTKDIVKLLIEKGADLNLKDSHSETPLLHATWD